MTAFSKTTLTYTVLHRSDGGPLPDDITGWLWETEWGEMVGATTASTTVPVPNDQIIDELLALGNDGGFFSHDDEEEA